MEPHTRHRVVLVAVDESENSDWAYEWYIKHIHRPRDNVILVHIPEYSSILGSHVVLTDANVMNALMKDEDTRVQELLKKFGEKLKHDKIGGKVKCLGGKPGEAIIQASKEEKAAMIVNGSRGMGALRRTLLGCMSDYVLHHSPVPLILCRHKDPQHH